MECGSARIRNFQGALQQVYARSNSRFDDDDDVLGVFGVFSLDMRHESLRISMKVILAWNEASNSIILASWLGFAAALAVLITGASQSKQHGMSKPARRSLID
ncbi:hypothetical protein Tco_0892158 [Tanacetum coccineum]|uniref:Uncharacterized protein n=1 Tax=Tanacetum coccineum TaxID=301880 RepID=A0ABQ5C518_9ASTR